MSCTTTSLAPVSERSVASRPPAAPPVPVSDYYTVQTGDSLAGIAGRYGQDPRQIAAWSNIDPAVRVRPGQVLRVTPPPAAPPPAVAEATPVSGEHVEQRPLGTAETSVPPVAALEAPLPTGNAAPVGADVPLKTGPLGTKRPYSEAALADLSRPDGGVDPGASVASAAVIAGTPPPPLAADDAQITWTWPASGPLLAPFDEAKTKGIDIGGKLGAPVFAAGNGTVIYVGQGLRGMGNLLVVRHSDDVISVYGHNSKVLVAEKQVVKRGDKIAEMGSADSGQPELHFEIRRENKPIDPLKFLPSRP